MFFFVPDTLEILVCDESLGLPLPFWKLGAFERREPVERKNMCVLYQLELGPFGQLECGVVDHTV